MRFYHHCLGFMMSAIVLGNISGSVYAGNSIGDQQLEENQRLQQEVAQLEQQYIDTAQTLKNLKREQNNLEQVLTQQRNELAAIDTTGETKVAVPQLRRANTLPVVEETAQLIKSEDFSNFKLTSDQQAFAAIVPDGDKGKYCLRVSFAPPEIQKGLIWLPLGKSELAGKRVRCTVDVKGENLVRGEQPYMGGRFGAICSRPDNRTLWPDAPLGLGTFDWQTVSFTVDLPFDCTGMDALLGMHDGNGTIYFRNFTAEIIDEGL